MSRSIGDAYLKKPEFSLDPSFPRFHLPEPIRRPVLTSEPSVYSRVLQPTDKFIIFASDGLWEHITNQEAAEIVNNNPQKVLIFSPSFKLTCASCFSLLKNLGLPFYFSFYFCPEISGDCKETSKSSFKRGR